MSAIGIGLGVIIDALRNPASAGPGPLTMDDLVAPLRDIASALSILRDTMDSADRDTKEAVTAATDAAAQIEEIGGAFRDTIHHTYEVVIPHSLSWLAGYVVAHWIDPLRRDIALLNHRVDDLAQRIASLEHWRAHTVDPILARLLNFQADVTDNYLPAVRILKDWLDHPDHLADWLAQWIVGPIVSYLADDLHKHTRDNLTLIIAQAWADRPEMVWDDFVDMIAAK